MGLKISVGKAVHIDTRVWLEVGIALFLELKNVSITSSKTKAFVFLRCSISFKLKSKGPLLIVFSV